MAAIPDKIAGYRLQKKISAGGMGAVYLATKTSDHGFEKQVAIKVMLPHIFDKEESRQLFIDEARLAAQLNHPNICQVFDFGNHSGVYYLVMEYVDGVRVLDVMQELLAKGSRIPAELAARIVADAARGLHFAHSLKSKEGLHLGVVHRDISPENIIVTRDGFTKVLDFGIARWENRASETQRNIIRGKAPYMSPEHASGAKLDARSDVFALGVLLHELLTLRPLFHRADFISTLKAVRTEQAPNLQTFREDLNPEIQRIVQEALQKPSAKRTASAELLSSHLEAFIRESGQAATSDALSTFLAAEILPSMQRKAQSEESMPNAFTRTMASTGDAFGTGGTEQLSEDNQSSLASLTASEDTGVWESSKGNEQPHAPLPLGHPTEMISDEVAFTGPKFATHPTDALVTDVSQVAFPAPTVVNAGLPAKPNTARNLILLAVCLAFVWTVGTWFKFPATEESVSTVVPKVLPKEVVKLERTLNFPAETEAAKIETTEESDQEIVAIQIQEEDRVENPNAVAAPIVEKTSPKAPVRKRSNKRTRKQVEKRTIPVDRTGKLSVQAIPWGIVHVNGKRLGTTPILAKELQVGTYLLEVRSPETEQVVHTESIEIEKGVHRKVKVRKR